MGRTAFTMTAALCAAFALLSSRPLYAQSEDFNTGKYLEIQSMILRTLQAQYVDSVDLDELIHKGINAMLSSLDPYTVFIPEENEEDLDIMTTASYGGVGALIQKTPQGPVIIAEPYENSAAVKCGLNPGDTILAIEGESTKDLPVDQCSGKMRGRPGTDLHMTVVKGRGGDTVDVVLVRERIHIPDVVYYGFVDDSTGYIQIGGFTMGGANDVRRALEALKADVRMRRLVLDLRGNGGGLMNEAVGIVSLFVPQNTLVVSAKGKHPAADFEYRTESAPVDTLLPLMVMVNSMSASSSEIVAGALQDMDRATVAGVRTYGKGLVQTIRPAGYNTSLKLTTAKYYTPSGRCVQAIDYSHRNEDGSVGTVPDSLKKEFKTRLGRSVYDGGGITPDIVVEPDYYSRPIVSLIYSNVLSDYAIKYFNTHDSIAPAGVFRLTDEEYADFVRFASQKEFDARTESQIEMEEVLKAAERERLADNVDGLENTLDSVLAKLSLSKEDLLNAGKDRIKPLLEDEIAQKFYLRRGGAESALRQDSQLHKALEQWDGTIPVAIEE
ncbi:MAG TPA: S41 family peptidase [Candidatus Coprenecus stercoravium]|uniref:S41 family peptidase n=1 Tax=Candidatus Coprenecus stercoravium TaxID=2840735 RepID=A0A9D2GQF7_9BACT|nr:S41 family peptidase [Candidatus Coprenecus stercoravium]